MEGAARQAQAGARSAAGDVTDKLGRAAEGGKERLQEGASAAKVGCNASCSCACCPSTLV